MDRKTVERDLTNLGGSIVYRYQGETTTEPRPKQVLVERSKGGKRPVWTAEFSWTDGLRQVVKYTILERLADVIVLFVTDDDTKEEI